MQIAKWGNSLAVRIPKAVVDKLNLKEGDDLEIVANDNGRLELITSEARREAALARMKQRRFKLPADYTFDREEANSRDET